MKLINKRSIKTQTSYDITVEDTNCFFAHGVLVHNSNGGIVWQWNPLSFEYEMQVQSRKRILTPTSDNGGFATFIHTKNMDEILGKIMKVHGDDLGYTPNVVRVYGEWCGGNIQKGVALNQLDKMFVIFAIKIDDEWIDDDKLAHIKSEDDNIFNIMDFPTYEMTIDFNEPKEASEEMGKIVDEVEKECPVGKAFDVSGVGEGIVWACKTKGWEGSRFWFKTKGDKHKSSGTKTKVPVDIERVNSINALVDTFLTESRLNQGFEHLEEMGHELSKKSTGHYLKWISDDVVKEELDTIVGNGFEVKEITKTVSNKARKYFFNKLDEGLGL